MQNYMLKKYVVSSSIKYNMDKLYFLSRYLFKWKFVMTRLLSYLSIKSGTWWCYCFCKKNHKNCTKIGNIILVLHEVYYVKVTKSLLFEMMKILLKLRIIKCHLQFRQNWTMVSSISEKGIKIPNNIDQLYAIWSWLHVIVWRHWNLHTFPGKWQKHIQWHML